MLPFHKLFAWVKHQKVKLPQDRKFWGTCRFPIGFKILFFPLENMFFSLFVLFQNSSQFTNGGRKIGIFDVSLISFFEESLSAQYAFRREGTQFMIKLSVFK